jgi:hypothetical protein
MNFKFVFLFNCEGKCYKKFEGLKDIGRGKKLNLKGQIRSIFD